MRARRRGGREGRWDHHHGPAALVAGGWRRPLRLGGWRWVDVDGRVVRLIWLWTAAAGRFGARFFSGAGPASESRAVGRGRRGSCRLLPLGRPGSLRPGRLLAPWPCYRVSVVPSAARSRAACGGREGGRRRRRSVGGGGVVRLGEHRVVLGRVAAGWC